MTDKFDAFVAHVADCCCNNFGTMSLADFGQMCAVVSRRDPPRHTREALRRLGYEVRGQTIVGLSARSAEFYRQGDSVEDALACVPNGYSRRWAEHQLGAL